jgi:hypothetical protein
MELVIGLHTLIYPRSIPQNKAPGSPGAFVLQKL